MQPRSVFLLFVAALALTIASFGFAQLGSRSSASHQHRQSEDRSTEGTAPQAGIQFAELPPVPPTTGDLVFNLSLTVKSAVPKNGVVGCETHASVSDPSGFSSSETAYSLARGSGASWSCKVSMPYSWALSSPNNDAISLSYDAFIADGVQITATNGISSTVQFAPTRKSAQSIASIKVPANGATTTEAVSMTF
jgi:hypothetical protein